jgi:hypothetical protein
VSRPIAAALLQRGGGSDADALGSLLSATSSGPPLPLPAPRSGGAREALRALFERLLP